MTQCTFKPECRHCSNGVSVLLKDVYDIKTHIRKIIRVKTPERPFCNNHVIGKSGWIDEMQVCYSIWSRKK